MRRTMGGASGRILKVAAERFAENGYRGTSIEDIASGAEISRSSLFWHFGSKEGLLRAVLEDTLSDWVGGLAATTDDRQGLEAVRALLAAMTALQDSNPPMVRMIGLLMGEASATEPALVPIFVEIEESMLQLWRRMLTQAAKNGELRPGVSPEKVASVIHAATFGRVTLWVLNPEKHPMSSSVQALSHMIDYIAIDGPATSPAPRKKAATPSR